MTSALAGRVREQARIAASAACARRGGSTNSPAGFRRWRRLDDDRRGRRERDQCQPRPRRRRPARRRTATSTLRAAWPPEDALDAAAMTAARWAFTHDEPAGAETGDAADRARGCSCRCARRAAASASSGVAHGNGAAARSGSARAAGDACGADRRRAGARLALAREMVSARTRHRNRAGAQHAAGLDLPRLPHAARLHPGRRRRA